MAITIRALSYLVPLALSVATTKAASEVVPRPHGWLPVVGWWVGLTVVATAVLVASERVLRRLLPLEALFRMSLAFPDQAPSRFKVALRTNTLRQLQRQVARGELPTSLEGEQAAAEHLLRLATALSAHDRLTRGHTERVRAYTLMIGEEMGLSSHDLDRLHWAGLVHDIGKLEVPPEILNKKGRPDDAEWEVLRQHPAAGGRLVAPLRPWLGEFADAASQHHERPDGKGYPYGLRDEEISLAGRIVAVADAFDVMTSVRSYKKAMPPEEARAELIRCAGTQFDAKVVRAFVGISIGRLRMVMGPLSWLAQVPLLGGGAGPAIGTAATAAVSIGVVLLGGPGGPSSAEQAAVPERPPAAVAEETMAADPIHLDVREDTPMAVGTLTALPADATSWRVVEQPEGVRVDVAGDGARVAPDRDATGTTEGTYEACRARVCARADLVVAVAPVNDVPIAAPDRAAVREDAPVTVWPAANDTDVEDGQPQVRAVDATAELSHAGTGTRTAGGTARLDGGAVHLDLPDDFAGTAWLGYVAVDDDGAVATGEIRVDVAPVGDPPVAVDDEGSVVAGRSTVVDVVANDRDPDGDRLRLAAAGPASTGDLAVVDGRVRYTAPADVVGLVTAPYTVVDEDGRTASGALRITVRPPTPPAGPPPAAPAPVGPRAADDRLATVEDGPGVSVDVLANDHDPDGQGRALRTSVVAGPEAGTARLDGGVLHVRPDPDASGSDVVRYRVCDADDLCDEAEVAIEVLPVNDRPSVVLDGTATAPEDGGPRTVLGWADARTGPADEAAQRVGYVVQVDRPELFADPPHLDARGTLRFTPAPEAHGRTSLRVVAVDDGGTARGGEDTSAPVTGSVIVAPVDDAPTAGDDRAEVDEDAVPGVLVDVLANDDDADGDDLAVAVETAPARGTASVLPDGRVRYRPDADAHGPDWFTYAVSDPGGGRATARVDVDVRPLPDGPVARDDEADAVEDVAGGVLVDVLADDTDADGDVLAVVAVGPADRGTASVAPDGRVRYVPAADRNGVDAFTYEVADPAGNRSEATVTVRVAAVNDPPVVRLGPDPTAAEDDGPVVVPGWVVSVDPGPADEDGQAVALDLAVDDPSLFAAAPTVSADGTLRFTSAPDAHGATRLVVAATDDGGTAHGGDATAVPQEATLTIAPRNDAPRASDDAAGLPEDGPGVVVDVLANDGDVDGDALEVASLGTPGFGTATLLADGRIRYVPDADAHGSDRVPYVVRDPGGATDGAELVVAVAAENDQPVARADAATVAEDDPAGVVVDLLANDTDVDGDPLAVGAVGTPAHGSLVDLGDGRVRYTPDPDRHGEDTVAYVIADGAGGTASALVTVTVTPVNDAPVAADDSATVAEDDAAGVVVDLLAGDVDVDGDVLGVVALDRAGLAHGTVVDLGGGRVRYTPDPDESGVDAFGYTVADPDGATDDGTVTVTVGAVDDLPVAVDDAGTVVEDDPAGLVLDVLANDRDPDGDALSLVALGTAATRRGTVTDLGGGQVRYEPELDATGTDTFTYTASDGRGGTATATVTVTITAVNDAPVAKDDRLEVLQGETLDLSAPGVLGNDDEDGDPLRATVVTPPTGGTLVLAPDGGLLYLPLLSLLGSDSFTYRATDPSGASSTATVTITTRLAPLDTDALHLDPGPAGDGTLTPAAPPGADPEPDVDGDGLPGITISPGEGRADVETDAQDVWFRRTVTGTPVVVDEHVALDLWVRATAEAEDVHPVAYLYDCDATGADCTLLRSQDAHVEALAGTPWQRVRIDLGSVDHTWAVGRQLVLRLQTRHSAMLLAASGARPSALHLPVG